MANRVRSPDGRWLALDARTIKLDQRTLSATYHATLRTELTGRLGVRSEPVVNEIAEIDGIDKTLLEEFSPRTADVARRLDEKLDRFIETMEQGPTPRERWQLEREAVESRPAKAHGIDATALHEQWRTQVEALGLEPIAVVDDAIWPGRTRPLTTEVEPLMINKALHSLAEKQSSWRPAEITRELAAVLPADLGIDPQQIPDLLDRLTTHAIAGRCVDISRPVPEGAALRRDGRPITEAATDRALTTLAILAQEHELAAWAEGRTTAQWTDSAEAPRRAEVELTVAQAETTAAVAGDSHLVLVVGPAGTGKTTALTPAVDQLHAEGRAVFGVAPSAVAARTGIYCQLPKGSRGLRPTPWQRTFLRTPKEALDRSGQEDIDGGLYVASVHQRHQNQPRRGPSTDRANSVQPNAVRGPGLRKGQDPPSSTRLSTRRRAPRQQSASRTTTSSFNELSATCAVAESRAEPGS